MDRITVSNYRCFGAEQTARLAPFTLFVGENSSGKTSLAAMIRAMWDVAYAERVPDFKEAPYDLGSFDEIAHHRGARGGRADSFESSFEIAERSAGHSLSHKIDVTFGRKWGAPVPIRKRVSQGDHWIQLSIGQDGSLDIHFGTPRGTWRHDDPKIEPFIAHNGGADTLLTLSALWFMFLEERSLVVSNVGGSPDMTEDDKEELKNILRESSLMSLSGIRLDHSLRPFAIAPTRSRPQRTYDPASVAPDSEGDHVPMYLAQLSLRNPGAWNELKSRLEDFGRDAGLFDEIKVRHLGKTAVDPFQIQVRKFGRPLKGPPRNLADVGYGVSQVLPLLAELLRDDGPRMLCSSCSSQKYTCTRPRRLLSAACCAVSLLQRRNSDAS